MITVDMTKAREIAHRLRRQARDVEFAPFDNVISKAIPGQTEGAEAARQAIREKYARIQVAIDAAQTVGDLNMALKP